MDKRIGVYLRVSTVGQTTEGQRMEIEAFLRGRGFSKWAIYEDQFSGTSSNRPALKQLLADARFGKLDLIVCWRLDRMYRSLKDLIITLQELQECHVEFISLRDQVDMTTSAGKLLVHLIGAFAEFEVNLIRERVLAGINNARSKGVKLGRPRYVNETDVLLLHRQGNSLGQIARRLNMSKSTVYKIVKRNPFPNPCHKSEIIDSSFSVKPVSKSEVKGTEE